MQNNGDESVGSVNMPTPPAPTEQVTPTSGSPSRRDLMRQRSFSSTQHFAPYGTQSVVGVSNSGTPTAQSGVIRGVSRPYIPKLAEYQQRLFKQVSAATIPISAQVAQTS